MIIQNIPLRVGIMIQLLMILFMIYLVLVIYLEYLVAKLYKKICPDKKSGIGMMLIGYRKKMNCLKERSKDDMEVQKVLSIDRIIRKISLLILVIVLFMIIFKRV